MTMKIMKPWDELTIRDNYLFKKVLTLNEDLCRRLLERVLGIAIEKMDIVQTELVSRSRNSIGIFQI